MGSIKCECGHITKYSSGESENELYLVSNPLLYDIEDKLDNNSITVDEMHTMICTQANKVYRCEKCFRLYIYNTDDEEFSVRLYALEETLLE